MNKRLASFLMLLMLLSSAISVISNSKIAEANKTEHNLIGDNTTDQAHSTLDDIIGSGVQEDSRQSNQILLNDMLGRDSNWSRYAYRDGDKVRLIIGVNGRKPINVLEKIVADYEAEIVNRISIKGQVKAVVVELLLTSLAAFVEAVHTVGIASYVEPNMKVQALFTPTDPYWSMQWGPQKIEADWAWNTTVGDPSVLVAVVDTGIYYSHEDISANYIAGGYDWANNDPDPVDDHGHGTHCAGIIAAVLNNGVGIAGLAQVEVMAEKVLDSGGSGYWDWVANGIIHATDLGADIISMSLGGYGDSELVHDAVRYAYELGVLVIAAAGNDNTNMKSYPAAYDEVIAVAATDQSDNKAWFSNWGEWIELAAPGVDIYSTVPGGYASKSGTSMACPHVSGVAALAWSTFPGKTRDWMRMWLRYTADDLGDPGFDMSYGYGRINARKTVETSPPAHELIAFEWMPPPYVEPGASATVSATVLNFGGSNETNVTVQLLANDTIVDSTLINPLNSGDFATVNLSWSPTIEGLCNVTLYVVPVPGETSLENNVLWKYIYVGVSVKAVVLHSYGNILGDIIANWQLLNSEWHLFGDTMVYVDYTTLNKEGITYEDIAATEADVLIISCAYSASLGWQFTNSEIEAITRYVHEGHGLIATAGTLYYGAPNNNKLAPLFGLNETTMWDATGTSLLNLVDTAHPIFNNIPNPLEFPTVGTSIPYDWQWDSNELVGGEYLALGNYQESAIVTFRGLLFISPWLEVLPPYYYYHLQLLYNAIVWSRYHKPEHDLMVSLEAPEYLEPGESVLLNATVSNMGLNNEINVELNLLMNGTIASNVTIPFLASGTEYTLDYMWTPSAKGIYNITAYAPHVVGEESTTNNVATKMVSVRSTIGYVIFEEAHLPVYTIGGNPAAYVRGGYSEFAKHLTINGYAVSTIDPGTIINPSVLAPADVLVIVAPMNSYLTSELDTIENWVKSGGNMLLISDWGPFGTQARIIASRFDITLRGDGVCDSDENVGNSFWPYYNGANLLIHPVTSGVTRVEMYAGDGITSAPLDEVPLIVTDSDGTAYWYSDYSPAISVPVMSAFDRGTAGSGKLIIITDSNVWDSAHDADMDGDVGFYDSDNEILALNSINWLSIRYEHDLAVSLEAPQFIALGATSMLNATVYNHGLSNETNVELRLLINGTVVSSATIPELLVDESHNINYTWTPLEGTYNVTAYAPPVLNETFVANNKATKFVTVVQPLIHPIEGQYANYKIYYIDPDTGEEVFGGLWNMTYLSYISSSQINVTIWTKDIYNNTQTGWMVINIFTRMVERDSGIYWAGMWYPGWIETNIGIGSTINLLWGNATVTDSRVILACGFPIDCWGLHVENYGVAYEMWYDKASGLWIAMKAESPYGDSYLILIETNVPIGFMYEHDLAVMLDAPTRLPLGTSTILNATVYNVGLSNETNVILELMVNGSLVASEVIPDLASGDFYTLSYLWTPLVEGQFNVTAYAPPVPNEEYLENNVATKKVRIILPIKVAVLGDYQSQLTNLLWENGIMAYERDWGIITDIYEYDAVIVNRPYDPGSSTFLAFIEVADHFGVGLVFTSSWPSSGEPYGISLLQWYLNDPEGQGHTYGQGSVYYEVVQEHPIFEGWNVGEKIYIITSGDRDHAWFWGYSGEVIGNIGDDNIGIRGGGIAYKIRQSGTRHLLLAGLAPQFFANTQHWTEEAKLILVQGALWVAIKPEQRHIMIYSMPSGVAFTVDGVSHTTPWSEIYGVGTSISLEMPETHSVGDARYYWNQWNDGNNSRSRTVTMTTNITLTAYFTGPYYQLTVTSLPIGITFTINGVPQITPYSEWLLEGSYKLEMSRTYNGYMFSHWLEDGDTNRIKTITLRGTTWTAVYAKVPVGGKTFLIDTQATKLEIRTPQMLSTIILSIVAAAVLIKLRKKKR